MGAREGYDPAFEDGAASEGWSLDAQCHVLACEKWSRMRGSARAVWLLENSL